MLKVTLVVMVIVDGMWKPLLNPVDFDTMDECTKTAVEVLGKAPDDGKVYGTACTLVKIPGKPA